MKKQFKKRISFFSNLNKNKLKKTGNFQASSSLESRISGISPAKLEKAILLIGSTGKGKSTLANVISGTNKFKESASSVSETKEIKKESFEEKRISYSIIDTVGISDTKMSLNEVLDKIAEAVYLARKGVSQVLFVIDGRFDQKEIANYNLLRTIIFDEQVVNHTTIIRTRFENFRDEKNCQNDIDLMIKKSNDLKVIIESCQKRIIHVDNPSLNLLPADNEDENRKKKREDKIARRKEARSASRKLLLKHLVKSCRNDSYQPPKLQQLSNEIADDYFEYLKKKKELVEELDRLRLKFFNPPKFLPSSESISLTNHNPIIEATNLLKDSFALPESDEIDENITHLENIKERLQKEITEKEKIIRQKVLKHILNNIDSITEQLGGKTFLTNLADDNHDWTQIHVDFGKQELKLKWLKEFDYQETRKWVKALVYNFDPSVDLEFCLWLRDIKHYTAEAIQRLSYFPDIYDLKHEYGQFLGEEVNLYKTHNQSLEVKELAAWTAINSNFADRPWAWAEKTYQQLWVSQEITKAQAQQALAQGFTLDDYMHLAWLRDDKGLNIEQIKATEVESLRAEYQELWKQLDAKFVKQARGNITYQQYWEANNLNYTKAQQWVKLNGVGNAYYCWPARWMQQGFDLDTTAVWLANGLKESETGLAIYARAKNYSVNSASVQKLKAEGIPAQHWLDWKYPLEQRNTITKLNISGTNLTEELDLSDFTNLTRLDCPNNQLTSLNLVNCQQLKLFWGHDNLLTDLVLPTSAKQLTHLSLRNNSFPAQQLNRFSYLVNCEYLDISNNPWTGSLAPLKSLTKLKELRIFHTELTTLNLASLPTSLTSLDIRNNPNLVSPDLTSSTQLVNLTDLYCQGTKLATQLEVYGQPNEYNNYIHLLKKAQQTHWQNQIEVPLKNN